MRVWATTRYGVCLLGLEQKGSFRAGLEWLEGHKGIMQQFPLVYGTAVSSFDLLHVCVWGIHSSVLASPSTLCLISVSQTPIHSDGF